MSIDITEVTDGDIWNELVEQSQHGTPFHRAEAVEVFAEYSNTTPFLFAGYKGQEPIGLIPLFSLSRGPVQAIFSPPPDLKIPYLGPILLKQDQVKQRKAERRHQRFCEGVEEAITDVVDPQYIHIRTAPGYTDPRPFIWNEYDITPRYTYKVNLELPTEDLFMSFSSDVRQNVRKSDESRYELSEESEGAAEEIIERLHDRYAAQNVSYTVPPSFASDLYNVAPDGIVRPYVCRVDEEFVGGVLTLEDDQTLYRWKAVNDRSHDVPATDLLDWYIIQEAQIRGLESYDLVGANNPRLTKYKSKFNPRVRTHYSIERSTVVTRVIKSIYKWRRAFE
jgi:hypothetical protein